tara:strand:- start:68 stop:607 length:540 start_codon:yes stop_codon:yes gene_type:complete
MRTYTFKVEVEDFNEGNGLLDNLINEVNDEKRQLAYTESVNKETSKVHMQILKDFCDELNSEFSKIGLGNFGEFEFNFGNTIGYRKSFGRLLGGLNYGGVVISIEGIESSLDRDLIKSPPTFRTKYITYRGKYQMYLYLNDTEYYTANQLGDVIGKQKINSIDDVVRCLESELKTYLHK